MVSEKCFTYFLQYPSNSSFVSRKINIIEERQSEMKEQKTPFVAMPLGTFDSGKMTAMMGLVLGNKAIENDLVNLSNYQDYLCYTLYLVKTSNISIDESSDNGTIAIDFNSVFINIKDPTEKQLNHMHSVLNGKIREMIAGNPADADDIKDCIIRAAEDHKKDAIDAFYTQAQAYLTTN